MPQNRPVRPAPDWAYRLMLWAFDIEDFIRLKRPSDILNKAPIQPGQTIVDYACGTGRYAIPAARKVGPSGRVYAVDSQPLAISIVQQKATRGGLKNLIPVLVDSFSTGIPSASADLVLLIDAISPIRDRTSLLQEIQRLLKPQGLFFMDSSHMSAAQARQIVEKSGFFQIVEIDGRTLLWKRGNVIQ